MQPTAPATPATTQADTTKTLNALRKRLERWELNHLRQVAAELSERLDHAQERIDSLETEVSRAWDTAEGWRMDAMQLVSDLQDAGQEVGLTQNGALVAMPASAHPSAAAQLPTIGTRLSTEGGTLGAIIARADGTTYGLIVADAEHDVRGVWGEYPQDVPGAKGPSGASNTAAMRVAGSTIAQAVGALTIGGHADWHIPSRLEMLALYEASPELFDKDGWYWSSSQSSRFSAWCQVFEYGSSHASLKDSEFRARPVRSIQLQPFNPSALPVQDIAEGDSREILGAEVVE